MALTYSPEMDLGKALPHFNLPTVHGDKFSSDSLLNSKAKLVAFICAHCPYVQAIEERLVQLGNDLKSVGIPFVAICSNDAEEHPEDAPEALKQRSLDRHYSFPYLIDEDQNIAIAFEAVCTPDFFIYDRDNKLAYRGRLDDSWKNPSKVTRRELYEAALAVSKNQKIEFATAPTMGCSIKWKGAKE